MRKRAKRFRSLWLRSARVCQPNITTGRQTPRWMQRQHQEIVMNRIDSIDRAAEERETGHAASPTVAAC